MFAALSEILSEKLNPVVDHVIRDLNVKCEYGGSSQRLCSNDCSVCHHKSFASSKRAGAWCYEKNEKTPREVFKNSHTKYVFNCGECPHSFESALSKITNSNTWCPYCSDKKLCNDGNCFVCHDKSFASSKKAKFWCKTNEKTPREVFKSSHVKYIFNCDECPHSFKSALSHISNSNTWCHYCGDQKLCNDENCFVCYNKSFASSKKAKFWCKTNEKTPREVFKSSDSKYVFNCEECPHSFESALNGVTGKNSWCPYCAKPSRILCLDNDCSACKERSFVSSEKAKFWCKTNKKTPREVFKNDNTKYAFNCGECGHSYKSSLNNITTSGCWCRCQKNKTELKLYNFLLIHQFIVQREAKFDFCRNEETNRMLPFDFLLEEFSIILELDGEQHFTEVKYFKSKPEDRQKTDRYKMLQANKNGYTVIRLLQEDVWFDRGGKSENSTKNGTEGGKPWWQSSLLEKIKLYDEPTNIFISSEGEGKYGNHSSPLSPASARGERGDETEASPIGDDEAEASPIGNIKDDKKETESESYSS